MNSGESVLVVLDSSHTKQHVLSELDAYHDLVTQGSYIISTDGIMSELYDVPNGNPEWHGTIPKQQPSSLRGTQNSSWSSRLGFSARVP